LFEIDTNKMTLEVLKLVKFMVSYGFYKTREEIKQIAVPLVNLLSGVNDVYTLEKDDDSESGEAASRNKDRYKITENNLIIMKCK
jgi:hypothetical protein